MATQKTNNELTFTKTSDNAVMFQSGKHLAQFSHSEAGRYSRVIFSKNGKDKMIDAFMKAVAKEHEQGITAQDSIFLPFLQILVKNS